ncbi:MAG: PspA-associated protein PspAA [Solirubrobacteraceae bacterium]
MIVRISNEGQYELADADLDELNELDNEAVSVCEAGDEAGFRTVYDRLLALVRERGRPLDDDELSGSELILPPPDVSLEEARSEFTGDGLIPG